ncbi:MAG TPA: succinate--CoA ligase subunit alpha [Candidatus Saccharimonadales bacterium]|nr:succinate--CoA ligase subunit alpha [Candidatus Saccharimonadales bacterium]
MAIMVGKGTNAIVQGITGSQGAFHTQLMLQYGTNIVAGVTPGRGGRIVHGIPVFDTVKEAIDRFNINASIIFVPAPFAKDAALEAISAKLNPVIVITEGIPVKDEIQMMEFAKQKGTTIIGPNTPGIITPNECKLGIMPGHIFKPGKIGLVSRSGTLTYEIAASLTNAGLGQSTCLGIGGDPVVGLSFVDVLEFFRKDSGTDAVAMIGEIGGNAEETAADYIANTKYPKPIAAYIAGRAAPPGKRMGHAGAIIMGKSGTAETKIEALRNAGVKVALKPGEIPKLLM